MEDSYLYHHTRIDVLPSILENGLIVKRGNQTQAVGDKKHAVFFSTGMEGAIAMAASFQRIFDKMKNGTEWEESSLSDYFGERVFLRFQGVENENKTGTYDFADGWTSKDISPDKIRVCILRNNLTGEILYERDDIIKYMMVAHPFEDFTNGNEAQLEDIKAYYESRYYELEELNIEDLSLEDVSLEDFISYINNISKEESVGYTR